MTLRSLTLSFLLLMALTPALSAQENPIYIYQWEPFVFQPGQLTDKFMVGTDILIDGSGRAYVNPRTQEMEAINKAALEGLGFVWRLRDAAQDTTLHPQLRISGVVSNMHVNGQSIVTDNDKQNMGPQIVTRMETMEYKASMKLLLEITNLQTGEVTSHTFSLNNDDQGTVTTEQQAVNFIKLLMEVEMIRYLNDLFPLSARAVVTAEEKNAATSVKLSFGKKFAVSPGITLQLLTLKPGSNKPKALGEVEVKGSADKGWALNCAVTKKGRDILKYLSQEPEAILIVRQK
ncbi:MAG: hypothetical protein LIO90_08600 [Bacteroidales bacterium]|nr:hypothetical protein [Bacteroidales bacterium]